MSGEAVVVLRRLRSQRVLVLRTSPAPTQARPPFRAARALVPPRGHLIWMLVPLSNCPAWAPVPLRGHLAPAEAGDRPAQVPLP
jgi:hypothetical protein